MRKIRRNMLKVKLGTNKIATAWGKLQEKKYGPRIHNTLVSQYKRSTYQKLLSVARRALA